MFASVLVTARVIAFTTLLVAATSFDVSEWLAAESKKDDEATKKAECWCKELSTLASSRLTTASEEIEQLGRTKESHHYENQRLRLEVKAHQDEAYAHSQSLDTHRAITERTETKSQVDVQEIQNALHGVRSAIKALPEGSTGDVHDTLHSLQDKFSKHLEAAQSSMDDKQQQATDLQKAKQEMMRLANAGAATKQQRLAQGLATAAQAERQIEVFGKQQQVDYKLQSTVKGLCDTLSSQATERQSKRQAAAVSNAQVAATQAQQDAMHAAGLVLLRKHGANQTGIASLRGVARHHTHASMVARASNRPAIALAGNSLLGNCPAQLNMAESNKKRARDMLSSAEKAAGELFGSTGKSSEVESALTSMLHGQMTGAHLAMGEVADAGLKTSVGELFTLVHTQLASLAAPFEQVRADGKESSLADSKLVIELRSGLADAEQAVLAAKAC